MLTLVPTPIGNIGDISLRAMDTLSQAEVLLCEDTRITKKLLNLLKERYSLNTPSQEFIAVHSHNESDFLERIEPAFFDRNVVYVSDAGMPGISDPGQELVRYCIEHGVNYDVLPGANAVLTAFAASGFVDTQMLFFGFLPHKGNERHAALQQALHNGYATILYESPHRLGKLLDELESEAPERQLFAAKELTKKFQRYLHGTAAQIKAELAGEYRGEWVIIIKGAPARNSSVITEKEIMTLDIPKKSAAKLIAKITGEHPKACYRRLVDSE